MSYLSEEVHTSRSNTVIMTEHVAEVDIKRGVFHYHNQTHAVLSTPVVVRSFLVTTAAVSCFAVNASCAQQHISRSFDQSLFAVLTMFMPF